MSRLTGPNGQSLTIKTGASPLHAKRPPIVVPPYADGYTYGVYYPDTVYISFNANADVAIASGFARLETNGPQTWSVSGDAGFYLGGQNGSTLYTYDGPAYSNRSVTQFNIFITVTDGTTTKTKYVSVQNNAAAMYFGSNFLLDTSQQNYYGSQLNNPSLSRMPDAISGWGGVASAVNVVDPAGKFQRDPGVDAIACTNAAVPLRLHCGYYPITISSAGVSEVMGAWIAQEQPAYIKFVHTQIYTHLQIGEKLGNIVAYSDSGIARFEVISSDDAVFVNSKGDIIAIAPLQIGVRSLVVRTVSNNNKVTQTTFAYTVLTGVILPSGNITPNLATGITNASYKVQIAAPTVTGLAGTPVWSVSNYEDTVPEYQPDPYLRHFVCDSATGIATLYKGIPARTHAISFSVTDGPNRCITTVNLTVPWHTPGIPFLHVGRGMAAMHPGIGYEKIADVMGAIVPRGYGNSISDTNYAGTTILVHYDADPNYYANDFNNNDANLRTGWKGPLKIINADPTGPRPRVGGYINALGTGIDPGDKGFFNIDVGDFVIQGLEISFVQGRDSGHGRSGIRKNADTWGDCTVVDCDIHDCDNGLLGGNGNFILTIDHCKIANAGTAYEGSGATHGTYAGACSHFYYTNNLVMKIDNGHNLKARALRSTITDNRFYDSERGMSSSLLDLPNGGNHIVARNVFHAGPSSQNGRMLQYNEEDYTRRILGNNVRINHIVLNNNTFILDGIVGTGGSAATALSIGSYISDVDGQPSKLDMSNNSFYLSSYSHKFENSPYAVLHPVVTETGTIILTAQPAVDFTSPGLAGTVAMSRPGPFGRVLDGTNTYNTAGNAFGGAQIDTGSDDIRVPHTASIGTTVTVMTAFGTLEPGEATAGRFGPGTTWSFNNGGENYPGSPIWDSAYYSFVSNADGTGTLKVNATLPAAGALHFVKVRAIGPGGYANDQRIYIVIT